MFEVLTFRNSIFFKFFKQSWMGETAKTKVIDLKNI